MSRYVITINDRVVTHPVACVLILSLAFLLVGIITILSPFVMLANRLLPVTRRWFRVR